MYLPAPNPSCLDSDFIDYLCLVQCAAHWVATTCVRLSEILSPLPHDVLQWLLHAITLENLRGLFYQAYEHFPEWPSHAFLAARSFFINHPHVVHITSFSIFFGPIVILLPLLLAHELIITILFQLSFALHGLLPGSLDDRYINLHLAFEDLKGSIFSSVDALGAKYNKLTTEYWPLVFVRLIGFVLGGVALYYITSEKQRQLSS